MSEQEELREQMRKVLIARRRAGQVDDRILAAARERAGQVDAAIKDAIAAAPLNDDARWRYLALVDERGRLQNLLGQ